MIFYDQPAQTDPMVTSGSGDRPPPGNQADKRVNDGSVTLGNRKLQRRLQTVEDHWDSRPGGDPGGPGGGSGGGPPGLDPTPPLCYDPLSGAIKVEALKVVAPAFPALAQIESWRTNI